MLYIILYNISLMIGCCDWDVLSLRMFRDGMLHDGMFGDETLCNGMFHDGTFCMETCG